MALVDAWFSTNFPEKTLTEGKNQLSIALYLYSGRTIPGWNAGKKYVRLVVSNRDRSTSSTLAGAALVMTAGSPGLRARSRLVCSTLLALLVPILPPLALADESPTVTTATTTSFIPGPLDFAVFATGTGCGAIKLTGNVSIDSFDSSAGTYTQTKQLSKGFVGVDGNIDLTGNATIYGPVFALNTTVGNCQNGVPGITLSGKAAAIGGYIRLSAPPTFTSVPIAPPGTTDVRITENMALAPGNYRNITVSGHTTLTLFPGTYNINSISITGQSVVTFSPPGAVIINVAGNNAAQPIQFTGGEIDNPTGIPSNFQLIYGGTAPVALSGGSNSHAVLYAPSAPVSITGGSEWFGAMVVGTLDDSGGVDIHYDRRLAVAPTIAALVSPAPNAAGWNNSNVTVSFTCTDPVFGIASCSPPVQITTEGANQSVTGTAVNRAGFSATTSVTINLDKTPPTIASAASPPPNAAGWNNSNVTVSFTCSDALSGIASCSAPVIVSLDGAGQIVMGTAMDKAGNTASAVAVVNLDKTPPTITATITPAPNPAGWNNANVTVTFTCSDTVSGVSSCPAPVQVTTEGARQVVSGTALDKAGNTATASVTVNLDKTPPILSITSPVSGAVVPLPSVTVTGSVSDLLSGVASVTCQGNVASISGSSFTCVVPVVAGPNTIAVQATDAAGNSQQASVAIQGGVPIILSATPNSGQQGQQNESVAVTGQFTHWMQGTTTATFGAGVTVVSLTVNSATSATALVNIDPAAALGARNVTLTANAEVATLANGFTVQLLTPPCAPTPPGIVSWWPLDSSGADIADGNSGTVVGGQFVPAEVGSGFNSSTGVISVPSAANLNVSQFTFETWLRADNITPPNMVIVWKGETTGGEDITSSYALQVSGTSVVTLPTQEEFGTGGPGKVSINLTDGLHDQGYFSNSVLSVGTFHHVATTVDGQTVRIYIDGQLDAAYQQMVTPFTNSSNPLQIGGILNITDDKFQGVIDELTLYNRALTGSEIQAIYASGSAGKCRSTALLSSINPNTAQQGQQNLSVTITGLFTHFAQGTTAATFGAGIAVASLTVNSLTSAVAVLNIDPAAAIGPRTVTVSTGAESTTLANGFTVTAAAVNQPPIVSAGPNQTITLQSAPVAFTEFPIPSAGVSPVHITAGPDGNLWFTEGGGNNIGRITPAGAITEFPVPTARPSTEGITPGPDGNLWFTEYFGQKIGRITPAGLITEFPLSGNGYPYGITAGPDGNVWFVERLGNKIGRITPAGVISEFSIPSDGSNAFEITTGPDGNLWFTEMGAENQSIVGTSKIGRITPAGVITEFPTPTINSGPSGITVGPDGNLWFTEGGGNKIGRITTSGVIAEFPVPTANSNPFIIAAGPDGNLWFTEISGNNIGRITPAGVITEFLIPTPNDSPQGITVGADCNVWFTEVLGNKIGKIIPGVVLPVATTLTGSLTDDGLPIGAILSATWNEISGPAPVSIGNPTATFPDIAGQTNPVITTATFCRVGSYILNLSGSDSQLSSNSSVTVTVSAPQTTIVSVSPNIGQQGQQNLSVTITGQLTHFVQGTTTASFGPGITMASLTVNSPTSATAVLSVDSTATVGSRDVSLTTGNEIATLPSGFSVTPSAPAITQINPNTGQQGQQNLSISITGQNTHFAQGTTTASFGVGIAVGTVTVANASSLTAQVTIALNATLGARTVTVTTGTELASLSSAFTVTTAINQAPVVTAGPNQTISLQPAPATFTEYTVPTPDATAGGGPEYITAGPGGALWFTEGTANKVAQISPSGVITEYPVPSGSGGGIAAGPDGNLWFTDYFGSRVWKMTPAGVFTSFSTGANPVGITAGPDGNIWFVERFGNNIGRITTAGVLTEFQIPTSGSEPYNIAIGPDGNLWFTEAGGNKIGRITPIGIITEFPIPTGNSQANYITTGPDGNVWFTEATANKVAKITVTGTITEFSVPTPSVLQGITTGPDGNIWVVEGYAGNKIARVTTTGVFTEFPIPTATSYAYGITVGPDCNLWFVEGGADKIGKLVPELVLPVTTNLNGSITDDGFPYGATLTTTWSEVSGPAPVAFGIPTATFPDSAGVANPVTTSAAFCRVGSYTLGLAGSDSLLSSSSSVTVTVNPPQTPVLSLSPNTGQQGQQNLSVTIAGQSTNFVQGTTVASFGAGITVSSVTVNSPTGATVVLNIDPAATIGGRDVSLTTGNEIATVASGFTITSSAPTLTQVSPNTGQLGQQNLSVIITAQNTHLAQGTTTVTFGAGITVASLTVNSSTSATAVLNIDPAATIGARNVTLTTGAETATLLNGFTVTAASPPPTITAVSPNTGQQGHVISIAITGQNTHFVQGVTTVSLGSSDITVNSVTVASQTSLTANVSLAINALTGPRTVTVTTGQEVVSLAAGFTVQPACVTSKEPGVRVAGVAGGEFLSLPNGTLRLYSGLYGNNQFLISFISSDGLNWTQEAGMRQPPPPPIVGASKIMQLPNGTYRMYYIADPDGTFRIYSAVSNDGLTFVQEPGVRIDVGGPCSCAHIGTPDIVPFPSGLLRMYYSCGLNSGVTGGPILSSTSTDGLSWTQETGIRLAPGGNNTGLDQILADPRIETLPDGSYRMYYTGLIMPTTGPTDLDSIFSAVSADGLTWANEPGIRLSRGAAGSSDSRIADTPKFVGLPDGTFRLYYTGYDDQGFTTILSAHWCTIGPNNPPTVSAGPNQVVTLPNTAALVGTASDDGLPAGSTLTFLWSMASGPGSVSFTNSSALGTTASFSQAGVYVLRLTASDTQLLTSSDVTIFVVAAGVPAITSIAPNAALQGQTNLSVAIIGLGTHFVQGTTAVSFGAGITVGAVTVSDSTDLTAQISVDPTAALGARTVVVTTAAELASVTDGFTVESGTPALLSLVPIQGQQGQRNLSVSIAGELTHFSQGTTQVSFGQGVTVGAVTVTDTTHLTVQINIDEVAALGTRTVTATTGSEVVSLTNSFTVQPILPVNLSVNPNTASQGQSNVSVIITGQNTHFVQGVTSADFGPGITVGSLTISSATVATAVLSIAATAPTGSRVVTVATNTEVETLDGGFSVLGVGCDLLPPGIVSWWPAEGNANDIISGNNGTLVGGVTFAPGMVGQAFSFNGAGGYMNVPGAPGLDLTGPLTLDAWIKLNVLGQNQYILIRDSETGSGALTNYQLHIVPNNSVEFDLGDGTNLYTVTSNTQLTVGTWYHVAAVYDGTNEIIYINGVLDTLSSIGSKTLITTPTKPLIIGATAGGGFPFDGLIDEVNIFDRGLQPSEVLAIAAAGTAGECQAPALSTVSPNAGLQGQQDLSVNITGQFTNFVQGTTTATFGAGITVVSLTIANPTTGTAIINIDSAAVPGARDVTLTTGTQIASLAAGFSVTATVSVPTITSISPNAGPQGEGGPVAIVGMNTHFVQGTTQVSFGPGIAVSNITVTCPTCLTAQLQISPTAVPGPVTVTVTTGSEIASLANGFTVQPGTPIIASFGPTSAQQGQSFTLTVTGQFTHFTQGTTQVSLGAGTTVSNISVSSATSLTAQVAIDPAATVGTRTLTVTTGAEVVSVANVFNVLAATPIVFSLNPGGGQQGQQNLSISITGLSTHWVQGTTTASFGTGVTVVSLTVTSATAATAVLNIDPAAAVGTRTVTVTTGAEVASFMNGFTISAGMPAITTVNPNAGQQGQQNLSVNITGQFTHFVQGTTAATFGAGIAVASLTVNSPTSATAVININSTAPVSSRDVTLTTGSEIAALLGGFNVTSSTPAVTQVSPNTGPQGQQNLQITITGQSTHFVQGTTNANFGAGITVASLTVNSATTATVVLNIDPVATPGSRNVTFTTGSEVAALSNGFTITNGTPVITQISPNSSPQGIQNLSVQIIGQFTHFAQGTTQVSFGTGGVTVNSVSVTNAGSLTANISIALNQTAGGLTVTVTTGAEIVSLPSGFLVQPAVNQPPVITIAPTWTDTLPNLLTITYGVADDGLPVGGALTVSWQAISGPGNVGFQNQTIVCVSCPPPGIPGPVNTTGSISVSFDQPGTYVLQIGATDSQLTTTQNVTVTVTGTLPPPPTVSITSPVDGMEVTTAVNVIGSVGSPSLSNWVLEYQPPNDSSFHTLATGTTTVTNSTLGTFDPTLLLNGIAYIRLTATDTSNQSTTTGPISLVLTRNQKVGNFTVSFNDLTVPVAGLPIQVVRTYDSRNRFTSGIDFSYGWTLDINAARLAESVALGDQWTETSTGGAFPSYCVQPLKAHVVTLTLQDGTTYQFAPTLNPSCQSLVPIQDQQVTITFSPMGATPPNAVLALVGNNQPFVTGSVPGPVTLTDADLITTFDPDQYLLTLPDGRTLQISMQSGLQKMTDLNGNTLTVTSAGITSSTGKSVTFTRNAARLITQITDPAGHSINYSYDPLTGNLTSVTDQSGNTTTFTYDTNHFLLTIVDPAGVQPIRNVYDNSGRLIQHIDAFGNVINYTNNLSANQEVVTDRLGNVTVNNYDADGNIVQVTDALGGVTNRTYDARDNLLTETNALNQTRTYTYDANNNRLTETDPLGNTTTYSYNARNQVLTITDALGRVTTNTYDTNGNLISTKDAAANTTTNVYNAQGLRTSMTDPLGGVSTYQYDAFGNLTQQTDPLSHITTYTYDANGNKLTETKTRTGASGLETLLTSYQYDASNRLIETTYADGSTTQIQYNAIGKQGITIDQLGRQTSYQYDLMGRLTQTTYPDATTESSTYDAEGDRITSTDRGGHITSFTYDPLKRLTKTTYADTAATSTAYDAIGEVTGVTDPRGNVTQYQYDDAGRRVKVIDALTHSTSFTYDPVGNQLSMTDPNGNTTQYQYDALNRRVRSIYPDSTSDSVAYDALGRTISKTDQAGLITQFQYDADGRLIQVTDAAHQLTGYTYDEIGERISQTDANNHTTSFAYDKLGRRTKRTLPLGMSETIAYDAAGNLTSKVDFNGKTSSYAYDQNNRLTTKTPDPSFGAPVITFTYTATGQRQNMVDASGTTAYSYDVRDRLLSKATPQGTLTYTYDLAGNLNSIRSSNTNGTSVNHAFDALNRLSTVTDNRLTSGMTTYTYDNAGNLQDYLYPSGVQHTYTYNTLNRLTNLALAKGASPLASYAYTLGPAGNRTAVVELGGRQVNYTYDALYRLTNETIAGGSVNGSIGYTYDAVGNRLMRTSTVAPAPAATYTYDANDRLTSDTYDADGNTTASGGNTYTYDFENHLTSQNSGSVAIVYDGDGNRVSKSASGVTTKYLVDDRNLTGYAQVLEEISGGTVPRVYTYGLNRISESQGGSTSFYGYDGHGSVRLLTDAAGAVTDRYDYDAFGNIISQAGTTPNVYLYSGEQNDPNLGLYYLRARYLNQVAGRFWTMDSFEGDAESPVSLDKYAYVGNEPVLRLDPSGNQFDVASLSLEVADLEVFSSTPTVHAGGVFTKARRSATTVSEQGLEFIERHEGFDGNLYNDQAGYCTIGYGHLVHKSPCNGTEPLEFLNGISGQRAGQLLLQDSQTAVNGITGSVVVGLAQYEFDSLTSFVFNVGVHAFEISTLLRKLNGGDYGSVPSEMNRFVYAGGVVLPVLVSRRKDEGRLFQFGIYQ